MCKPKSLKLKGQKLIDYALKLGVSLEGTLDYQSGPEAIGARLGYDEAEVQHRVRDAERSLREGRLWMLAVVSAIASVISAAAAWMAILMRN